MEIALAVQPALDARGIMIQFQIPPGTPAPRVPPPLLNKALTGLLMWLGHATPDGPTLAIRCERKPVLLRSREGEVRKDFLMLTLGNAGALSAEDQQRKLGAAS